MEGLAVSQLAGVRVHVEESAAVEHDEEQLLGGQQSTI